MFIKSVRSTIPTSLWLTVFLAASLAGCTPVAKDAHAEDLTAMEFCAGIEKIAAGPHLIVWFDEKGNIAAAHGGKSSDFPPEDKGGNTPDITEMVSVPVTIFEGSNWFCYKIAGKRTCIEYP